MSLRHLLLEIEIKTEKSCEVNLGKDQSQQSLQSAHLSVFHLMLDLAAARLLRDERDGSHQVEKKYTK
jgi:hypothetical protein